MTKEERDLWDRYCKEKDNQAREALVLRYLSQVDFWVSQLKRRLFWVPKEDLRHSGTIGLIKAVDAFDPDRKNEFSTYSRWWIRAEIFISSDVTRHIPRQLGERFRKVRRTHDELMQQPGREPTTQEIADRAELTPEQVEDALTAIALGFPDGDSDGNLNPFAEDSLSLEEKVILKEALSTLKDRDRKVMLLSFWSGMSASEIGAQLGLTPNYVKQIRFRSLDSLGALFGVRREKNSAKQQKGHHHGA